MAQRTADRAPVARSTMGHFSTPHLRFHICVIDGMFEAFGCDLKADQATPPLVVLYPASELG